MTMVCMVEYLEARGFKAERKYDPTIKKYKFTIEREGEKLTSWFEYPSWARNDIVKNQHQREFLDGMIKQFEKEFNVESLYPKMMTSLFGKPSSKWTDPKTGKEFGYSWGFDRITGDFSDYVKNDIQSTSYVSDIINKIIHEKEQEEMKGIQWKVTKVDITNRDYDAHDVEVKLRAYFNGPVGHIDPIKLTDILQGTLNAQWPKQNPLVPSTKLPAIEKVIFNDPATIIIWKDETKTVVKCQKGDTFDPEKGFAMAVVKKVLGNQGNYCETVKKWTGSHRYDPHHSSKWLATQRLYNALGDKKATKADLKAAMEEAVKYLEEK